jgi:hypothetical protein
MRAPLRPLPTAKRRRKVKSSSGDEHPFQEFADPGDHPLDFLNRNRGDQAYADWIDAENDRKDAEWEKRNPDKARPKRTPESEKAKLDEDVKASPTAEAFLQKMRDRAAEQQRDRGEDKPVKHPEGRPGFKSPLPPYHTPPNPSGKGPPRRSEPRSEYDKDYKFESKAAGKTPERVIPPYKPTLKPPPGIPRFKPGNRTDTRTITRDARRPLPPSKKPTSTVRPLPGVRGGSITTAKRR